MQQQYFYQRTVVRLVIAAAIIIVAALIFTGVKNSKTSFTIKSDIVPSTIEIGDKTYKPSDKNFSVRLKPGYYKYRVVINVDGSPIPIIRSVDLTSGKQEDSIIASNYSKAHILSVICAYVESSGAEGQSITCPFDAATVLSIKFLNDYNWVVVKLTNPSQEPAWAALTIENGDWIVKAGPGTDIVEPGDSQLPDYVIQELKGN